MPFFFARKLLFTTAGGILIGIGVNLFLVPHRLMDGGIIGIGLLGQYYFGWPPGGVMLMASLPIYVLICLLDQRLFVNSFLGTILTSVLVDALSPLRMFGPVSLPIAAVTGGICIGVGTGLMLAYRTNSGATDLLAQFLAARSRVPVAALIFIEDGIIIAGSVEVNGPEKTVFSLLTIISVALATHFFSQVNRRHQPWEAIGPLSAWLKRK
ncbi:YitT family protein [Brevibacillus massiliensis]|uniref:YitT family protein n=1 Tax=Brevibacillus massiliensis TaxID=1118054 RepID=UPI0002EBDA53|nr:YitT family protein [Brevibacillus massiliensis]